MNLTTAILSVLIADEGRIAGRTLLQKKVYFLGVLSRDDPGFAPHLYGPYMPTVSATLDALVGAGILREQDVLVAEGPLGEIVRRDYGWASSDIERSVSDDLRSKEPDARRYDQLLRAINDHEVASSVRLLSAAAKVHFVLSQSGTLMRRDIQANARQLGWELTPDEIESVLGYLKHLKLVKVSSPRA